MKCWDEGERKKEAYEKLVAMPSNAKHRREREVGTNIEEMVVGCVWMCG